jgi:hypothetical protein
LQTVAYLDDNRHARLVGQLECSLFQQPQYVNFLIDTGSTTTTLLGIDILRLGINCGQLPLSSLQVQTANGNVNPHELRNVRITFLVRSGLFNRRNGTLTFPLTHINCLPNSTQQILIPSPTLTLHHSYSLLGMDVLKFYPKWYFKERELVLER